MNNQFTRYAYSPYNSALGDSSGASNQIYKASQATRTVFTGGDIGAYINQIPVTNLESASWTIQVDVVPNYVMGDRDAVAYTTGRRQISGTLIFSQYDRHALLEQVFQLSSQGINTQGALWKADGAVAAQLNDTTAQNFVNKTANTTIGGVGTSTPTQQPVGATTGPIQSQLNALGLSGITASQYNLFVQQAAQATARVLGSTNISYVDQLPPFDLTLIGVARSGQAAKCSIFGIQCTTESGGFSSADISNAIGISYVALGVSPWRAISSLNGVAFIPPVS